MQEQYTKKCVRNKTVPDTEEQKFEKQIDGMKNA